MGKGNFVFILLFSVDQSQNVGGARGVQIQSKSIKTAKPIQSKPKTDQNSKSLDWFGFYFHKPLGLDRISELIFKTDSIRSKPNNII